MIDYVKTLINSYHLIGKFIGRRINDLVLKENTEIFFIIFFLTGLFIAKKINKLNLKLKIIISLFIITLIATILRLNGLNFQSLWYDELVSLEIANSKNLTEIVEKLKQDTFPPLYFFILHYTIKFLGNSEKIVRLPSVIFGILSVIVIFFLGKKLYSYKEGLISAILMTFFYTPIYYSQEARPYSMLVLITILQVYFLTNILQELKQKKDIKFLLAILFIIFSIINNYTHYFGLYFTFLTFLLLDHNNLLTYSGNILNYILKNYSVKEYKTFYNNRFVVAIYKNKLIKK